MKNWLDVFLIILLPAFIAGCDKPPTNQIQGYVEGEFVYVSSPLAGTLTHLNVERGQQVKSGDPLFELDDVPELAALDESQRRFAQAQASVEDAKKGKRPPEIESIQAQLSQAQVQESMAEKDLSRNQALAQTGAAAAQDLDHAKMAVDSDRQQILHLQADLQTAQMGMRVDQVDAAEQEAAARNAQLAQAKWNLSQKRQEAFQSGVVFDTLYRTGEWVAAGRPIVVLLPPANVKVRAFIPESKLGGLHVGQTVSVAIDGAAHPISGRVSFISPQAEFTPPVIYSQENRSKLVFLIEIVFDPADAVTLHPGQPVEVQL